MYSDTTNDGASVAGSTVSASDESTVDDALAERESRLQAKKKTAKKSRSDSVTDRALATYLPFDMQDQLDFAATLDYNNPAVWNARVFQENPLLYQQDRGGFVRRFGTDRVTGQPVTGLCKLDDIRKIYINDYSDQSEKFFLPQRYDSGKTSVHYYRGPWQERHSSGQFYAPHRKRDARSSGRFYPRHIGALAAGEYGEMLRDERYPETAMRSRKLSHLSRKAKK